MRTMKCCTPEVSIAEVCTCIRKQMLFILDAMSATLFLHLALVVLVLILGVKAGATRLGALFRLGLP